jgi:hypothetical protein
MPDTANQKKEVSLPKVIAILVTGEIAGVPCRYDYPINVKTANDAQSASHALSHLV